MDSILADYLSVSQTDLAYNTLRGYKSTYNRFSRWLEENGLEMRTITQPQIQSYISSSPLKASTLKTEMQILRAAFHYGRNCTLTIQRYDDPFARLRYPKEQDREPITFSNEEILRLYNAIETDREWIAFHLMAYAGFRRAEVCRLRWEDVEFQQQHLTVLGKGNRIRKVPLHPRLAHALAPHRKDEGFVLPTKKVLTDECLGDRSAECIHPNTLAATNRDWYARAGVDKGNHSFRRTMNSVLRENGVRTEDRERIMGWVPRDIQGRHYTRFLDSTLHDAIRKLDYGIPRQETEKVAPLPKKRHLAVVA